MHTLALSDITRTWLDGMGWAHAICSCGKHLVAPNIELQLGEAHQCLENVRQILQSTNVWADGPRPELDRALRTVQLAINVQEQSWSKSELEAGMQED
jgi:hypothetical protein